MNIVFYVDSGPTVGMGHVMRSLAMAAEFQKRLDHVSFMSFDPTGIAVIRNNGFQVTMLKNEADLYTLLKDGSAELLIVDSYQVDSAFFLQVKPLARQIAYIDDLNRETYPIDIVINGNFGADRFGYPASSAERLFLLGNQYTLLREEFQDLPQRTIAPLMQRILITFGGSDPVRITPQVIETFVNEPQFSTIDLDVTVGAGFQNIALLKQLQKKYPRVHLFENVTRMAPLMFAADLAITAGGSTLYELCACGLPSLAVILAANQERVVTEMAQAGIIANLGWHDRISWADLPNQVRAFDKTIRTRYSERMRRLVDGYGVVHTADAIHQFVNRH